MVLNDGRDEAEVVIDPANVTIGAVEQLEPAAGRSTQH